MTRSAGTTARVLVVDDNPTIVRRLARSLEKNGYAVQSAADGETALEIACREQPDLILLDLVLPGLDGLEICRLLRQDPVTERVPVIFLTACTQPEDIIQAFAAGGCDYITKPFIVRETLARVSVHVRLRQTEQELLKRNGELVRLSNQLAELNDELARQSRVDPLTGLLNRRAWQEAAALECERSRRRGSWYGIAYIDVDHFKQFNDSQGHSAGDECLQRLASSITSTCRVIDFVGRYGGEEFIVLFPETEPEGARQAAERIRTTIWDLNIPHPRSQTAGRVTVSLGVTAGRVESWEDLVKQADGLLYEAKRTGRNRTCQAARNPDEAVSAAESPR